MKTLFYLERAATLILGMGAGLLILSQLEWGPMIAWLMVTVGSLAKIAVFHKVTKARVS